MNSPVLSNPFGNLIQLYLYRGGQISRPGYLYDYILAENGVVKRVENNLVSADHLLIPFTQQLTGLGLAQYPIHPIHLKPPRIPGPLLQEVLQDARRNVALEYMYQFHYDPHIRKWTVLRPEQVQSQKRVVYVQDNPAIFLDLHSHNTMPAFWSPEDDRDELGGIFYAVMGRLEQEVPELALRLGMYGQWIYDVPAEVLFDSVAPFVQVQAHFGRHNAQAYADYWVEEETPGGTLGAPWLRFLQGGK